MTTTTYRLSGAARALTWRQWQRLKGCGLSDWARYEATPALGPLSVWSARGVTLGDVAAASVLADRELARYAVERLGRPDLAVAEYAGTFPCTAIN